VSIRAPDGTLDSWAEISKHFSSCALLCGNGLSINVWPRFEYSSLFAQACDGALSPADVKLFAGSENFELTLSELNSAIRVNQALDIPTDVVFGRYRSIQRALGHAIREVHVPRTAIPDGTLARIRAELVRYDWIFSISYDLLVYWAMRNPHDSYEPFVDLFRGRSRLRFDPARTDVATGNVPVLFPHGALHLVVGGDGETWKLRQEQMRTLLDQFGEPIEGDSQARPLLVTEGTARDKLRAIEGNAYLSHVLDRLRRTSIPTVVFGASLGRQDEHLLEALREHPTRPVAISMVPGPRATLKLLQGDIWGRLAIDHVYFFNAETHPLGNPALRVPSGA